MVIPAPILLIVELAVIVAVSRALARLMRPMLQPAVVGEMVAGVLLGPSVLGRLWPSAEATLFPADGRTWLIAVGQAGLIVHMIGVGLDTRVNVFRMQARSALTLSLAGLMGPFLLGAGLAAFLHGDTTWFGPGVGRATACLYLGAAMAITAFPVLARIVEERGLAGTPLATLVLSAGACDDLVAWLIVSALVWSLHLDTTLLLSLAFVAGLLLPRVRIVDVIRHRLEPVVSWIALPAFFACSGLATRLDLIHGVGAWGLFAVILACASVGKGLSCWLAARWTGHGAREAAAIGALMNARGLMELVILNLGLQAQLITPELFTLMAAMALVTTFAASPLFELTKKIGSRPGA